MTASTYAPGRVAFHLGPCLSVLGTIAGILALCYWLVTMLGGTPQGQFLQRGRPIYDYEASIQIIMDYARGSQESNDVIFLGSSTCRNGLDPVQFAHLTGLRAYNLGLFGMMEWKGLEVVWRTYLEHHPPPRLLVLCVNPEDVPQVESRSGAVAEIYSRFLDCFDHQAQTQPAADDPPLIDSLRRQARYTYFNTIHGPDGYKKVPLSGCTYTYDQLCQEVTRGRGFWTVDDVIADSTPVYVNGFPFAYTAERCEGIESIFRLAQAHGVKCMVRFSPLPQDVSVPPATDPKSREALRSWTSGITRFCPGTTVSQPEIILYDRSYFVDRMHLNRRGAAKFTAFFAAQVRQFFQGAGNASAGRDARLNDTGTRVTDHE